MKFVIELLIVIVSLVNSIYCQRPTAEMIQCFRDYGNNPNNAEEARAINTTCRDLVNFNNAVRELTATQIKVAIA